MADEGHLQVIEAMMVAMLLLGAAYTVLNFKLPTSTQDRTRAQLGQVVADGLTVLSGLRTARGNELAVEVLDALQGNATNLTLNVGAYLPAGASYAIILDNGERERELYRSSSPIGEVVSAGIRFAPDWNLTYVQTELSCYEATMDVNATLIPIYHAVVTNASAGNAKTSSGATIVGVRSNAIDLAWNATLPAATRPAAGTVTSAITAKHGTLAGATAYGACDLAGQGAAIVAALRQATMVADGPARAGGTLHLDVDTTALRALPGVTVASASVDVIDPLPAVHGATDAFVTNASLTLPSGPTASLDWPVPATSLYGAHPLVLRANLTVGATTVQARAVGVAQVALANGVVPLDPPYLLAIQAWLGDWR